MTRLILALALLFTTIPAARAQAPAPITSRVVGTEQLGDGSARLLVAAGQKDGVQATWKAYLVDAKGDPVPGGSLSILRVDKTLTYVTTSLPPKEARAHRVRLEP